jgi:hypothetical protein
MKKRMGRHYSPPPTHARRKIVIHVDEIRHQKRTHKMEPDVEKANKVWGVLQKILETQGVQIVGWIFAGGILYGIYVQYPVLVDRIDKGYQEATDRFAHSQEKFAKDILESSRVRSDDLKVTLKAFRDDEREDRRLLVEVLRRSDMTSQELSEAIEAVNRPEENNNPPP